MIAALLLAAATPPLVPLLERMRLSVPDARAVVDLQVCPVDRRGNGLVAFARPREPRRYFRVTWRDGRATRIVDTGIAGDGEGLMGVATRGLERHFEACPFVSSPELAAAWSSIDGAGR